MACKTLFLQYPNVCQEETGNHMFVSVDLQLDTCLYFTVLSKSPPDLLSSHVLDTCTAEALSAHG